MKLYEPKKTKYMAIVGKMHEFDVSLFRVGTDPFTFSKLRISVWRVVNLDKAHKKENIL